jgi:hypothetical protein
MVLNRDGLIQALSSGSSALIHGPGSSRTAPQNTPELLVSGLVLESNLQVSLRARHQSLIRAVATTR